MTNTTDNTSNNSMKRMSKSTTRKIQSRRTTRRSTIPIASCSSLSSTTILLFLLYCSTIITVVNGLGEKVSRLPLYESTPTHCDEMVDLHKWEGSCCSLNVTEGNGCVLNVRDGDCVVRGQIWTLNYTSTSNIPCPPSEYTPDMLGMKPTLPATEPEAESSSPGRGATNTMGIMQAVSVIGAIIGTICLL